MLANTKYLQSVLRRLTISGRLNNYSLENEARTLTTNPSINVDVNVDAAMASVPQLSSSSSTSVSPLITSRAAQIYSGTVLAGVGAGAIYWSIHSLNKSNEEITDNDSTLTNWSGTHEIKPKYIYEPENETELEAIVKMCHKNGHNIRVMGSCLSPNGIAFNAKGMLSMAQMDKIIEINEENKTITVQSGARVEQVTEILKEHNLTLQNFGSIKEQQIGGFTQIGVHGTGARIPPADEQVIQMKLVTPSKGTLILSKDDEDRTLFDLCRVGLGMFGVVSEVTLQCVPLHLLEEITFVTNMNQIKKNHQKWIKENKHLRYMWIPHTDAVVVVKCNPLDESQSKKVEKLLKTKEKEIKNENQAIMKLLLEKEKDGKIGGGEYSTEDLRDMTYTQLRGLALAQDPLDYEWVKKINLAEVDYWKQVSGTRIDWNNKILEFDCGDQQWVSEVAFPTGKIEETTGNDIKFMAELLKEITENKIAAHSPIEHRWTSNSSSTLSPVYGMTPNELHSWVGIIMYLPTDDYHQRIKIQNNFMKYANLVDKKLMSKYDAIWHWAKIEIERLDKDYLNSRMALRYPVSLVQEYRKLLDPKNIMGNTIVDTIFPIN